MINELFLIKKEYYLCIETKGKIAKVIRFDDSDKKVLNKRLLTLDKAIKLNFNITNVKKTCHDYAEFQDDIFEKNNKSSSSSNTIIITHHDGDKYTINNWNEWYNLFHELAYKYF